MIVQKSVERYLNGVRMENVDGKVDTTLQTSSGKFVSVLFPKPEQIDIADIAAAVSKLCRFNGHTYSFYSVAQHSVLGAQFALKHSTLDVAKEFLLHDATEAYVGDLIRPVKVHLPEFEEREGQFWKAISTKFNLPVEMSPDCKAIDDIMVTWEKRDLLPNSGSWPRLPDISKYKFKILKPWSFKKGEREFLKMYGELFA